MSASRTEHDRLVAEARQTGGWSGCLLAAYAGVIAAEHLDIDCPFAAAEGMNAEWWRRGHAQGLGTPIPKASVTVLPARVWIPKHGTTHAARCVRED